MSYSDEASRLVAAASSDDDGFTPVSRATSRASSHHSTQSIAQALTHARTSNYFDSITISSGEDSKFEVLEVRPAIKKEKDEPLLTTSLPANPMSDRTKRTRRFITTDEDSSDENGAMDCHHIKKKQKRASKLSGVEGTGVKGACSTAGGLTKRGDNERNENKGGNA
jgi:hypothetical protein